MGTSASPRSLPSWRRSARGSVAQVVVGVLCVLVPFGIAGIATFGPVSADVAQPTPPHYVWVGLPPTVPVSCGTLLDPHPASFGDGVRYVTPARQRGAETACAEARHRSRVMALGSGSAGALLLALVVWSTRRARRDA